MADLNTKFGSGRQDWETPDELWKPLNAEFAFELDVCATAENAKCARYYTPEQDGLKQQWRARCWMNPPFKTMVKWIKKAHSESQNEGATVVCLLPARTNTNWWHDYCMKGEVRFIRGRPRFKGAEHGLPQPLAIVIFRPPNEGTEARRPSPLPPVTFGWFCARDHARATRLRQGLQRRTGVYAKTNHRPRIRDRTTEHQQTKLGSYGRISRANCGTIHKWGTGSVGHKNHRTRKSRGAAALRIRTTD